MLFLGIICIIGGIVIIIDSVRSINRWESPLLLKLRGWIAGLGLVALGLMIIFDSL